MLRFVEKRTIVHTETKMECSNHGDEVTTMQNDRNSNNDQARRSMVRREATQHATAHHEVASFVAVQHRQVQSSADEATTPQSRLFQGAIYCAFRTVV
jgi:hypothetical protein